MSSRVKKALNIAFILGALGVVIFVGIRNGEMEAALLAMRRAAWPLLLAAGACYGAYTALDALSLATLLRPAGYSLSFSACLFTSVTGLYYNGITPGASGGQPMQAYTLSTFGVPVGKGTAVLAAHFVCFQGTTLLFTAALHGLHADFVAAQLDGHLFILLLGYAVNALALGAVCVLSFTRRPLRAITALVLRIAARLRLKSPEKWHAKVEHTADMYHQGMKALLRNKKQLTMQLLLNISILICYGSIVWFVYQSLSLRGADYGQMLTMSMVQFVSASYVFTPGASGAQEGVFSLFYSSLIPGENLLAALLLWRFLSYYIPMFVLGLLLALRHAGTKKAPHPHQQGTAE